MSDLGAGGSEPPGSAGRKLAEIAAARDYGCSEEEAIRRIRDGLADPDDEVRAEAAAAVWDYWDVAELVEAAIERARSDASTEVRIRATSALGRILHEWHNEGLVMPSQLEKVRGFLREWAAPTRPLQERRYAIEALAFGGADPDLTRGLEDLTASTEKVAHISALIAMGRCGDPRWTPDILGALEAPDAEIRLAAACAAGEAHLAVAAELLCGQSQDEDPRLRRQVAMALGQIGDPEVSPVLLRMSAEDSDETVRAAARVALDEVVSQDPELDASDIEGLDVAGP